MRILERQSRPDVEAWSQKYNPKESDWLSEHKKAIVIATYRHGSLRARQSKALRLLSTEVFKSYNKPSHSHKWAVVPRDMGAKYHFKMFLKCLFNLH